jgi:hypothetical protein
MVRQSKNATCEDDRKLRELIQALASRIPQGRDRRIGEQNVKATLIEPILEVLGWDIRDWDEVHREYRGKSTDSPVDYALKILRTPRLFLEAKGLGEDLSDRKWVAQVLGYATVAGVEWCVLTDGDEWRFYNAAATVDADEKLFRRVRLSEGNLDEAAKTLSLLARDNIEGNVLDELWKLHFVDRRVKGALKEILETPGTGIVRLIRRREPKLKPKDIVESLWRLELRIESPEPRLPASAASRTTEPTPAKRRESSRKEGGVSLADLIDAGLLKAPVRLFHEYKGRMFEATLLPSGDVEFEGRRYATPSAAGAAARQTVTGRDMATSGWKFWQVEVGGEAQTLWQVRDAYLKGKG